MSDEFNDEHSGQGGSYVVEADGKRVLQQRTDHAAPAAQPIAPEVPAKTTKQPKGVNNA